MSEDNLDLSDHLDRLLAVLDDPEAEPLPAWYEEFKKTGKMPKDRKVPVTPGEFWVDFFAIMGRAYPKPRWEGLLFVNETEVDARTTQLQAEGTKVLAVIRRGVLCGWGHEKLHHNGATASIAAMVAASAPGLVAMVYQKAK